MMSAMNIPSPLPLEVEELSRTLVDSAFKVHQALGPGLLESVYEACLCVELGKRGIRHETQAPIPLIYEGVRIEAGLRLDLLVEKSVILELKADGQAVAHPPKPVADLPKTCRFAPRIAHQLQCRHVQAGREANNSLNDAASFLCRSSCFFVFFAPQGHTCAASGAW